MESTLQVRALPRLLNYMLLLINRMTVKELFKSLEFKDIAKALKEKYGHYENALRPLTEYKEDYIIILHTEFSGEGGSITFKEDGDSDVYMIEGDSYDNIVGMEVILPENGAISAVEAAAQIIWSAAPFGRVTSGQWHSFFEDMVSPSKGEEYALKAKRVDILLDLPYCRDKKIKRELKQQMNSLEEDLCLSVEADRWLMFHLEKRKKVRHNRSKRKRAYRLEKRYEDLCRLSEVHKWLNRIKGRLGLLPQNIEQIILASGSIDQISYQTHTYGETSRIAYLEDLLTNPLYREDSETFEKLNSKFICILYSSKSSPCTQEEINMIAKILGSRFKDKEWYLFLCTDITLEEELELEIISFLQRND